MKQFVSTVARKILENLYYAMMPNYTAGITDPYCGGNVKFPVAKNCHIPHVMFPTEVGKTGSKVGNHYIFLFFKTVIQTIEMYPSFFSDLEPIDIVWSEKQKKYSIQEKCLIIEHGWLPRSSYQISTLGANGRGAPPTMGGDHFYQEMLGGRNELLLRLDNLKKAYYSAVSKDFNLANDKGFIVVPMQVGTDLNLRDSSTHFSQHYGKDTATTSFVSDFVNTINNYDFSCPVYFTQHPVDKIEHKIHLRKNDIFIFSNSGVSTLDLMQNPNCKGVISVNSNVVHEAICLNVPCCVLGRLYWREDQDSPFVTSPEIFVREPQDLPHSDPDVLEYLSKLLCFQWYLTDLQNPLIVREIIMSEGTAVPCLVRKKYCISS